MASINTQNSSALSEAESVSLTPVSIRDAFTEETLQPNPVETTSTSEDNFIFRKTVDWSLLNYGFTIPRSAFDSFCSNIKELKPQGEGLPINLLIDNKAYSASLIYQKNGELQVRFGTSSPAAVMLREIFSASLNHFNNKRNKVPELVSLEGSEYVDVVSVSAGVFGLVCHVDADVSNRNEEADTLDNMGEAVNPKQTYAINPDDVVAWLVTQPNANGTLYLERVARSYMSSLRNEPKKLLLEHSVNRNVFRCHTASALNELWKVYENASNYVEVNRILGHGQLAAGLSAYRRFLKHIESQNSSTYYPPQDNLVEESADIETPLNESSINRRVDFNHPELCSGCDPVTCIVEGINFYGKNWRDLLVALTEYFLSNKLQAKELYSRSVYPNGERPFLLKDEPELSARQISSGHWIYMNLGIKDLVFTIGKLCQFCGVDLKDVDITYVPKSSAREWKPVIKINYDSARFAQQPVRDAFRSWLIEHYPEWSNRTVMMHYSDAYYLFNNERGITLEEALTVDDGLQRAYDAIERYYINNPTQTNNPSGSARGYLRSLRMLKEFLTEKYPELLNADTVVKSTSSVPDTLIDVLNRNYSSGFRFDTTYINLLSNASGVEVDERMQLALKRIMFRRDDGIYFLLDTVADAASRKNIVDFADTFLEEYGCFEIPEFYKLYEDKVNSNCIRNADDFESFYEQIGKSGVRCVAAPQLGNRIARYSNGNVWGTFKDVAAKIVSVITEEYYGSCNEDDLHTKFCAFSTDLLGKIIKYCAAEELIRVEINDSVCYQTFDALGLPDNFLDVLAETLERLSDIGLEPTQDVLHTAISLKLGVNFKAEFNLPDWDTYRRLVAAFYKAEPRREWKYNIFGEVTN